MPFPNRLLFPVLCLICGILLYIPGQSVLLAQTVTVNNQIQVEARHIHYDRNNAYISATGNVMVRYKEYTLTTEEIQVDYNGRFFEIPGAFTIRQDGHYLAGEGLNYNARTLEGELRNISAKIDKIYIAGEVMSFNPENIVFRKARFTTCEYHLNPDYEIRSDQILLYPQWGFFVAFNNTFVLNGVPIAWFPTYAYGSRRYSLLSDTTPLPEFGSNHREGFHTKIKYAYFLNPGSSGSLLLGYGTRIGLLTGISHNFALDPFNAVNLELNYLGIDGLGGGMSYEFNPFPVISDDTTEGDVLNMFLENLREQYTIPLTRVRMDYKFKELIETSRVDKKPLFTVYLDQFGVKEKNLYISGLLSAGNIAEYTLDNRYIEARQIKLDAIAEKKFQLGRNFVLTTGLSYFGNWYDGPTWQRLFGIVQADMAGLFFNPRLTFRDRITHTGVSPFFFEQINTAETDEVGLNLYEEFGTLSFGMDTNYNLEDNIPRNLDLTIGFLFHCIQLRITWGTVQGNITFGVSLI